MSTIFPIFFLILAAPWERSEYVSVFILKTLKTHWSISLCILHGKCYYHQLL